MSSHPTDGAQRRLYVSAAALIVAVLALTAGLPGHAQQPALADGDPEAGQWAYRQCATCHAFDPQQRKLGPHLDGIIGRPAAALDGYRYSQALRKADLVWTKDALARYITDPRGFVPGGTMVIPVRDPAQVPDIIAYLEQQGGHHVPALDWRP